VLILDDPIKNDQEARSRIYRERLWDWWRNTFLTRREPNAGVVLIMTRWHYDDLAGRIMREDSDEWETLMFPAIAEADEKSVGLRTTDVLGRKEGDPLWPERFPVNELERIRERIGLQAWNALYQQRPTQEEGQLLKREWWRYTSYPEKPDVVVQAWDTAFKTGQENDYSVCVEIWRTSEYYYVANVFRGRLEYPELKRAIVQLYDGAKSLEFGIRPSAVVIEDTASGQSAIQELKRDSAVPIIPVKVDRDKIARVNQITGLVEAGKVVLPERASWLAEFIEECAEFPVGLHDDQVDAFVHGLSYLHNQVERYQQHFVVPI